MYQTLSNLLHLFYPHHCEGCGSDVVFNKQLLCARCRHQLPETNFFGQDNNPVEKLFYGRVNIHHAGAGYYFTKNSLLQHLIIQLKYRDNQEAGHLLGRMLGSMLLQCDKLSGVDALVPLPLNHKKEQLRGYNQALLICKGIHEVWNKPVLTGAVTRSRFTETQTRQNRLSRWQNMEGVFEITDATTLRHKHILLIDDVITTGATLEACSSSLLAVEGVRVSIGAVAFTV